jgi:hypothetical protein
VTFHFGLSFKHRVQLSWRLMPIKELHKREGIARSLQKRVRIGQSLSKVEEPAQPQHVFNADHV